MEIKIPDFNSIYNDVIFLNCTKTILCVVPVDLTVSIASFKRLVSFMITKAAPV